MSKGLAVVLCIAAYVLGAQAVEFARCDSPSGEYTKVTVSGCGDDAKECILQRNTVANITIDFDSKVESSALTTVVHGIIAGMDMPFPLQNPDACASGVQCPLQDGSKYEYQASLPILKAYPKISVIVKWELKDAKGDNVVCVKIPAKIK